MKPFDNLTVGELKSLTEEEILQYAPGVGMKHIEDNKERLAPVIGERIILGQIDAAKKLQADLEG